MQVEFYGHLRSALNCKIYRYRGEAASVHALLTALQAKMPAEFHRLIFDGQAINPSVTILVNGKNIYHLQGAETPLHPDDYIQIMPVLAGGQK